MEEQAILEDLGLTQGEIKVYYSLFELGQTTVGPLSKRSGVTHAKVYPILDRLIAKGLASSAICAGRKNFSATHPNALLELVDRRVRALREERKEIEEAIPKLLALRKEDDQYSRVYEGFAGLRSLFHEVFTTQDGVKEVRVLGLNELLRIPAFMNFFLFYHEVRKGSRVRLRLILNNSIKKFFERHYIPTGAYSGEDQVRFLNAKFPTGVFIVGNHVITVIGGEKVTAFDIKSLENARRYAEFFDALWTGEP